MKFSIIIPIYNTAEYLSECLRSIEIQEYADYEVILVDDGSTDESYNICSAYAEQHKNVMLIHKENSGVSESRNIGFCHSRGDYILFIDSDDFIDKNLLSRCSLLLEQCDYDLLIFGINCINENYDIIRQTYNIEKSCTIKEYLELVCRLNIDLLVGSPVNKIYKAQLIKKHNIKFETGETFAEDFVFNLNYLRYAVRVYIISARLYTYRMSVNNSLSKKKHFPIRYWYREKRVYCVWENLFKKYGLNLNYTYLLANFYFDACFRAACYHNDNYKIFTILIADRHLNIFYDKQMPVKLHVKIFIWLHKNGFFTTIFFYLTILKYINVIYRILRYKETNLLLGRSFVRKSRRNNFNTRVVQ
jgi:glycosyltransferase involved in cell wall biosynthesis